MVRLSRNWLLQSVVTWDHGISLWLNRSLGLRGVRPFFSTISWLGNGKLWYGLMLALPLIYGTLGLAASSHLVAVGAINVVLYRCIKSLTRRPRPCNACDEIMLGAAALDEYSFPSGHTMHAVGFTLTAVRFFPALAVPLLAFTLLVAVSRVILGLHYPTDVALGATIGSCVAWVGVMLF